MSDLRKLNEQCFQRSEVASLRPHPLQDGSGWCVELMRHDGRVEQICTFGSETSAQDWIDWEFPKFFRDKLAH